MVLEDRSLHSLEDRTYGARRSFVTLTRGSHIWCSKIVRYTHSRIAPMMLEDRSLHSLEDRTYGARRSFVTLTRGSHLWCSKIVRYTHSKNFKALRADLQGLCPIFKRSDLQAKRSSRRFAPIFKPQAIFKVLCADLQAAGDLQGAQRRSLIYLYVLMVSKKLPFCQYLSV